jgi:hypothetical protein
MVQLLASAADPNARITQRSGGRESIIFMVSGSFRVDFSRIQPAFAAQKSEDRGTESRGAQAAGTEAFDNRSTCPG